MLSNAMVALSRRAPVVDIGFCCQQQFGGEQCMSCVALRRDGCQFENVGVSSCVARLGEYSSRNESVPVLFFIDTG